MVNVAMQFEALAREHVQHQPAVRDGRPGAAAPLPAHPRPAPASGCQPSSDALPTMPSGSLARRIQEALAGCAAPSQRGDAGRGAGAGSGVGEGLARSPWGGCAAELSQIQQGAGTRGPATGQQPREPASVSMAMEFEALARGQRKRSADVSLDRLLDAALGSRGARWGSGTGGQEVPLTQQSARSSFPVPFSFPGAGANLVEASEALRVSTELLTTGSAAPAELPGKSSGQEVPGGVMRQERRHPSPLTRAVPAAGPSHARRPSDGAASVLLSAWLAKVQDMRKESEAEGRGDGGAKVFKEAPMSFTSSSGSRGPGEVSRGEDEGQSDRVPTAARGEGQVSALGETLLEALLPALLKQAGSVAAIRRALDMMCRSGDLERDGSRPSRRLARDEPAHERAGEGHGAAPEGKQEKGQILVKSVGEEQPAEVSQWSEVSDSPKARFPEDQVMTAGKTWREEFARAQSTTTGSEMSAVHNYRGDRLPTEQLFRDFLSPGVGSLNSRSSEGERAENLSFRSKGVLELDTLLALGDGFTSGKMSKAQMSGGGAYICEEPAEGAGARPGAQSSLGDQSLMLEGTQDFTWGGAKRLKLFGVEM